MANLSVTASSVRYVSGQKQTFTAGETITAGCPVYQKSSDLKYYLANSNDTLEKASVVGISLHGALANQPLTVQTSGVINMGAATLHAAEVYILSSSAGLLADAADSSTDWYLTIIGYGETEGANLTLVLNNTRVRHG